MNNRKICAFVDYVKYVSTLSTNICNIKDDLINYFIHLDEEEGNIVQLSSIAISTLQNELRCHPKYINSIIELIKHELFEYKLQDNGMSDIQQKAFFMLMTSIKSNEETNINKLLCLLSLLDIGNTQQDLLNKLCADLIWLERNKIINYFDLYLTLLSRNDIENLRYFLEYDLRFNCDTYDHSYKWYKYLNNMFTNNVHWLIDIINSFRKNDISSYELAETLNGKLLHLVMLTICDNEIGMNYFHPIENLTKQMEKCPEKNPFVFKYCQEQCRKIAIARFCYENSLENNEDLFKRMQEKSLLNILNNMCVLSDFEYEKILKLLNSNKNTLMNVYASSNSLKEYVWEEELYKAYFIIISCTRAIILLMQEEISVHLTINLMKQMFNEIENIDLRLEVLQYMFTLLFLRYEHISCDEFTAQKHSQIQSNLKESGFLCTSSFVKIYLSLLKTCIQDTDSRIKIKNGDTTKTSTVCSYMSKLNELTKYVERACWRFGLLNFNINDISKPIESVQTPPMSGSDAKISFQMVEQCTLSIEETMQNECVSALLSPPGSLLIQCLLQGDFQNVQDVIQIYEIEASDEARQAKFLEEYIKLKSRLRKMSMSKQDQFLNELSVVDYHMSSKSMIKDFLKSYKVPKLQVDIDIYEKYKSSYPNISFYDHDHNEVMIISDLIITSCIDNISTKDLIKYSKGFLTKHDDENPYKKYLKNIIDVFQMHENNSSENISIMDVIVSDIYPRDIKLYEKLVDFNKVLLYNLSNIEHIGKSTEDSYMNIMNILENNPYAVDMKYINKSACKFKYMKTLLEYLQKMTELVKLDPNYDTNLNMFHLLNTPLKKIIGDLVHNKNVLANDIENITNKMGIDLVQVLTSSLCDYIYPKVAVERNEYTFNQIEFDNSSCRNKDQRNEYISNYKPDIIVMTYLRKHNWLVAYLIENLHNLNLTDTANVDTLKNTFVLQRIQNLKALYGNNATKTAIIYLVDIKLLNRCCEDLTEHEMLKILSSIPEIQYKHSTYIRNKKNTVLKSLSAHDWKFMQFIHDIELQYNCILQNLENWDENSLKNALQCVIENTSFETLDPEYQEFLIQNLHKVSMYEQVIPFIPDYTWIKFQNNSESNTNVIFEILLTNHQIELCLNWINLFPKSREKLTDLDENLLCDALQVNYSNMLMISKFLHELDINQALIICERSLQKVTNINAFKVFGQFILHHENTITDSNLVISINILMDMDATECVTFFKIICHPLLIIEQYLMNCKFDKLTKIIHTVKKKLINEEERDVNAITMLHIEKLLVTYAKTSLRFDVANVVRNLQTGNEELIQPLETPLDEEFTMPDVAPKKSEWIANELANECMCCKQLVFTMFNRRHHCRRCGRVVCGLCSMNRLKLSAYNDLNVRACNQCYDQTKSAEGSSGSQTTDDNSMASSKKDFNLSLSEQPSEDNEWILTGDLDHDNAIREEFSFIHAPSVSLCLAILTLHDDSEEAPNFLLSECEAVIRIMKPKVIGIPNNEIDYPLLIEMMRSMVIAAKVKYSHLIQLKTNQCPGASTNDPDHVTENKSTSYFYAGISRCEDILNYADLASLLVQHGCEGLLTQTLTGYDIQVLREQLVRSERWVVALDVSLKAGLDRSSVFAAWGKACLKAGAFRTAREKFTHCLRAVQDSAASSHQEDIFTRTNFAEEKYSTNVFKYSSKQQSQSQSSLANLATSKNRPQKDPALLYEIIDILEKATYAVNSSILKNLDEIKQSQENLLHKKLGGHMRNNLPEPALNILHTLSNLKNITNGIYEPVNDGDKTKTHKIKRSRSLKSTNAGYFENVTKMRTLEKFIFDECKYYLITYGSHIGIIKFYMKHSTLNEVLEYILNNNVDKNVFTEVVYMECLKKGTIGVLHRQLSTVDATLLIWKDHLSNTCRYLEKLSYMNTLYDLQLFMKDHVRASMTCIYFYSCDCSTYSNLHQNVEYLNTAEKFLRQELESVITEASTTFHVLKEASSSSGGFIKKLSYRELDRHISTICKQREVAKFLAECEVHGRDTFNKLNKMFATHNESNDAKNITLPTLFGSQLDRLQVATLVILCGQNVEEGFGLAFRIAQDYQLQGSQLYRECARYLARCGGHLPQVAQLCRCVRTSGLNEQRASALVDELAAAALYEASALEGPNALEGADTVIHAVSDVGVMISCYINIRQLKSAYLLAVKHDRLVDVRRIQREAERLGQTHVVALCNKRLNM